MALNIRLNEDEIWEFVEAGHTGILTTLRRDGMPIALPVWYTVIERIVYVGGPPRTKKFARLRNDSRVSFLVESGKAWADLKAVQLNGNASFVEDEALRARIAASLEEKYSAFRTPQAALPEKVSKTYAAQRSVIAIATDARVLSWDNARIPVR